MDEVADSQDEDEESEEEETPWTGEATLNTNQR
jgi:hypothetical protein